MNFKKLLLFAAFLLSLFASNAQMSLTNGSPSNTITFANTMQTGIGSNPSTAFAGAGFDAATTTAGRLNSNAWAVTGWSDGALAFGGTRTTATTDYTRGASAVAVTTGGFYAGTAAPQSAANPCLMIQPGGTDFAPGTITLRIINNGTTNITNFAISYNLFVRNDQGRSSSFNFSHSTDNSTYTAVGSLDYTTTATADALGWVQVGSSPSRSTTITGLSIAPGSFFYIRWSSADVGGSGSRDEIGLDDIAVTATFAPANTTIAFTAGTSSVTEGTATTPIAFTVTNPSPTVDATVSMAITGGTGSAADVGSYTTQTITIPANTTSYTYNLTITDDALVEGTETVAFTISSPAGGQGTAALGAQTTHTLTINDNDTPTSIAFTAGTSTVSEGTSTTPINFTVTSPSPTVAATVSMAITGGTGSAADVGSYATQTITIPANTTSYTYNLTVTDDVLNEGTETVTFTISSPGGGQGTATLGAQQTHTLTINDNDFPLITVSPTSLTIPTTMQNTASASQTYNLSATNLVLGANNYITVTAPTNFAVSTDNSTFTSSVQVAYSGATLASTPIYVRLTGTTAGSFGPSNVTNVDGNGNAATQNVAVSGTVEVFSTGIFSNAITGTDPGLTSPYTAGQIVNPNITVSGIGRGTGISGAAASNRYSASGWSTGGLLATDYFTFTLTPNAGYEIDFTNFTYTGQVSTGTPTLVFRSSLDGFTNDIGTMTTAGTTISLSGAAYQNIQTAIEFRVYGYGFAAAGTTYSINDFTFNGTVPLASPPPPPGTSTIVTTGTATEPTSISSLINTSGAAVLNFDFKVVDDGSANDALNTLISDIVFNQALGNDVSTWSDAILGAQLTDGTNTATGTISSNAITFASIPFTAGTLGYIADDATKTYTLKVWLKTTMTGGLPTTVDGLNLVFGVDNTSFTFDAASSTLASAQSATSGATNNAIDVVASALTFITQPTPTTIATSTVFTTPPVVEARDANGNRDLNYTNNATITTAGGLTFAGQSTAFVAGLFTFPTFNYTSAGNGTLTVTGSGSPSTTAAANCNTVTVTAGPCLNEGFAGGTSAPSGWAFTGITATYTSAGNYGVASPSIRFDNTNDIVTTQTVTNPTQLSFWYKGQGTDANSYLLVQGLNGGTWQTIDSIRPLATTGTTMTYVNNINSFTQFRFTYNQSAGNLALDDVAALCGVNVVPTNNYQSVTNGNWNSASSWEVFNGSTWVGATTPPDFNANNINILSGHTITVTQNVTTDQTTVNTGGILVINPTVRLTINDGTGAGADLTVNGTLTDKSTGSNGLYLSGSDPRWVLGTTGTFIKEGNSSANVWQCTYLGADAQCRNSAIPATSTWIVRQTGTTVSLSSTYMYYGNLKIENTSGNAWNGSLSQGFQGGTSTEAPVIKGNFEIGTSGSNTVSFNVANTNANPVRVDGNLTVGNLSALNLGTSGQTTTGIEVKGNLNFSTTGSLTYGSSSGSNRQLKLSGTAQQTISGGGTVNILNMLVSNSSTQGVVMGRNIKVDNLLTLNSGSKLSVNGSTLELAGTVSGTGTLTGSITSNLNITGTGALGTLYFTQSPANANTFKTVTLNKTGGAIIGSGANRLNIYQNLDLVAGTLTTNANLTTLSSAAQTAYINDFTSGYAGTLSGNVAVERYITNGPNGFRYIGAPVATTAGGSTLALSALSGFVISGVEGRLIPLPTCSPTNSAMNSPYGTFMRWDEAGPFLYNCRQAGWYFQTTGTMTIGRGYGAKVGSGTKITYTGAANTGAISYGPLANSGPVGNGWHLVANPFPSSMAISNVDGPTNNDMPAGFNGQIQLYITSGPYTGSYTAYNTGLVTAPFALGQGFWVQSTGSGTFTVNNNYRVTNQVTYYDVNPAIESHLSVDISGNGFMDKTDINFMPAAQTGKDFYDADKWESRSEQPTLYTTIGSDMAAINTMPSLTEAVAVPMGVKPGTSGNFTLTFNDVASFPQSAMIYLEDLQLGTMTDLRANSSYEFTANTSDNQDRFMLHFKPGVQVEVADQDCDNAGSIEVVQPSSTVWSSYNLKDNNGTIYAQGTNFSGSITVNGLQPQEYILTLVHPSGYVAEEYITVNGTTVVTAALTASATNVQVDEAVSFTATANNATELIWNFGDGTLVTGNNTMQHAYEADGTYNVTLTAQNDVCNDVAYKTITVGSTTGIDNSIADALKIYGQGNQLIVEFSDAVNNKANLAVFNMLGQKVESFTGISTLNGRTEVMLTNVKSGYYIVQVITGSKVFNQKVYLGAN
jgi:hypothetical protein